MTSLRVLISSSSERLYKLAVSKPRVPNWYSWVEEHDDDVDVVTERAQDEVEGSRNEVAPMGRSVRKDAKPIFIFERCCCCCCC